MRDCRYRSCRSRSWRPAPIEQHRRLRASTSISRLSSTRRDRPGVPKGVMLTHANIVAATTSINGYLQNREDDTILDVLPLSFDYGLYQLFLAMQGRCARTAGAVVRLPDGDAGADGARASHRAADRANGRRASPEARSRAVRPERAALHHQHGRRAATGSHSRRCASGCRTSASTRCTV